MSELKKKILEGIRTNGMQEWAFMINDYDGIMDYEKLADEDIDELATAILNEIAKQPQLNENQQIVLEWLKLQAPTAKPMQVIFWMMNNAAWGKLDELRKPIMHLTDKQQAQVLEEFGKWAQEQEEKQ